jgi:hypothetical protein
MRKKRKRRSDDFLLLLLVPVLAVAPLGVVIIVSLGVGAVTAATVPSQPSIELNNGKILQEGNRENSLPASDNDNITYITNSSSLSFTGIAGPGTRVAILLPDGKVIGRGKTIRDGTYRIIAASPGDGQHKFTAVASSFLNYSGEPSEALGVYIDTQPPQVAADILPVVDEAVEIPLDSDTFTDSSPLGNPTTIFSIDWGDGAPPAEGVVGEPSNPAASHVYGRGGPFIITACATDLAGGTGCAQYPVVVNRPPVLEPLMTVNVGAGGGGSPAEVNPTSITMGGNSTVAVLVAATDPDGNSITLGADGLPNFVTFTDQGNGTGTLRLTPGVVEGGVYGGIAITASDGRLEARKPITITVLNNPPLEILPASVDLSPGASHTFSAAGGVAPYRFDLSVNNSGGSIASASGEFTAGGSSADDRFGYWVALDGDTALVGVPSDDDGGNDSGTAYVFVRLGGVWTQQAKLTAGDAAEGDRFGRSVALDRDTALVGARADDDGGDDSGSVYVFVRSKEIWTQQAKLTAGDAAEGDLFGHSVALDRDTALVGANRDDGEGTDSGSAYIFVRDGGIWTQQARLTAGDAAAGDLFGESVSVSENTALVGAVLHGDEDRRSGSAYIFGRRGTAWTQQAKLTASDAAEGDLFGQAVALDGDTALVGSSLDDGEIKDAGSAYIYGRSGNSWTEQARLSARDGAAGARFGQAVALDGDTALVGANRDGAEGSRSGAALVFVRRGTLWTIQARLTARDAAAGDLFGQSVALSGETALVGVPFDDDRGIDSGSADILERSGESWTDQARLSVGAVTDTVRVTDAAGNTALATVLIGGHDFNGCSPGPESPLKNC